MKILLALTYYRPHVSGLTIYVERLGQGLVRRGHEVTVLTSQHSKCLPRRAIMDGVEVIRVPVVARVSKGVIMPTLGVVATQLIRKHDALSIHLPQIDATGLALRGRFFRKPTILTYHCDLQLPPGRFNRVVDQTVAAANLCAGLLSDRVVAYTQDYADHASLLRRLAGKTHVIPPPVVMPAPLAADVHAFKRAHQLEGRPVIGFAARFAAEKGIEYLVDGMPALLQQFPNLKVIFAGPYDDVLGEEDYRRRLASQIDRLGDHWEFVGTLGHEQMPAFFGSLDCLLVTSINSTESFGLVQVEAMLCGTPVVTSDLPGVRQPVLQTGMGEIVPVADTPSLVDGISRVLCNKQHYVRPRAEIEQRFDIDATVSAYESLFDCAGRSGQRRAPS